MEDRKKLRNPGYASLREFRESKPEADYFLTTNLKNRGKGLETAAMFGEISQEWRRLEADKEWLVRTAVVMPDHIHLLIQLEERAALEECMRRFKGRLARRLRVRELVWQEGFYDHRICESSELPPVFFYIFLNPYRAGLIKENEHWPAHYCREAVWAWFGKMTGESFPQPEWLR